MRPFQFMIACRDVVDLKTLAERARWAESIGCSHIATHDHLAPQHALIPLLTAVAKATQRLRLCQLVLNNDLRHPAVLAQELASLDVLSGGRVEVGIGVGWNEPEYRATGLAFDPAGTRIERLTEAIAVLRGLFADGPFSFAGRFYVRGVEPTLGFEPRTCCLRNSCSTAELCRREREYRRCSRATAFPPSGAERAVASMRAQRAETGDP
jgi:alkanesulfonate monooxygenase SsuD/methylene tetrahydromethanopterin reductase-like flavin-dependent oxidoreductase (luciferase family)